MQLPLDSETIEASRIMHEQAMYQMRDWYVQHHRLVRLEKDGTDKELLTASVDHIFPCKLQYE